MPEERVELSRGCPRGILSPLRLPFRHSGEGGEYNYIRGGIRTARSSRNAGCSETKRLGIRLNMRSE